MTNSPADMVTSLAIEQLRPNPWNPNQMTDAEFQELVDEVRRLGRVPKPVVVRPQGDSYEIIDGEHNWQAAQDVGLTELPCEVIEANDFEAMRQTYKRNQHGQHCRVREGRMFRAMCESQGGVSHRDLAREAGISEGTIRNRLLYAHAADMRNRYAGESRVAGIDGLKVRQVRAYVDLPPPLGDLWLDAGGQTGLLGKYKDHEYRHVGLMINRYELLEFLDPGDFRDSFARIAALAEWLEQNDNVVDAVDYARPIAEMQLPPLLAWFIPVRKTDDQHEICIDLEQWLEVLASATESAERQECLALEAAAKVYEQVEGMGIEPSSIFDGPLLAYIEELIEAPDYIREAHFLSLYERMQLHHAQAPVSADVVKQAKQATLAFIQEERSLPDVDDAERRRGPDYVLAIFLAKLKAGVETNGHPITSTDFDRDAMLQSLDEIVQWCPPMRDVTFSGRPAIEVFRDRMSRLRTPELVAIRALLDGAIPTVAIGAWMDALQEESATENPLGAYEGDRTIARP